MAEFRKFHVPNLLTEYENSGLLVFHFPIEDGMVPEDVLGLVRIFLLKLRYYEKARNFEKNSHRF